MTPDERIADELHALNENFAQLIGILKNGGLVVPVAQKTTSEAANKPKQYYWDKSPSSISNSFPIYRVSSVHEISALKKTLSIFDSISDAIDDAMQHGINIEDLEVEGADGKTESASKYL